MKGKWTVRITGHLRVANSENIRIESTECDSRIFGMLVDFIDCYDVYTVVFSLALYFVVTRCVRCGSRILHERKFTLWSRLKRLVLFHVLSSMFEEPAFAIFRVNLGVPTSWVTKFYTLAPMFVGLLCHPSGA